MLRGYRGIILALVGVASLGATEPPKPSAHVQQTTEHREPASGANPTRSEQPQEPDKATEPCKAGEDKRFSDLCAQWKAADASKNAADYSFWTIIVSSVGTGLLIWTLWETRETSRRENAAVESVWFYARVTYRDIFKRKRRTDICLEYAGGTEFRAGPCNNIAT
jgi:hypothetical protein